MPGCCVYLPPAGTANGTGVVICPGGGFRILAIDKEGIDVARWLNTLGVAAFVLKYRVMRTDVPAANPLERRAEVIPLSVADGKRALALVRSRAAEWGVKPGRLGIMGFSAGGYVTAAVAMSDAKPDFAAPIYAGVPPQVTVPAGAPPLFLVHATDDRTVNVVDSTMRLFTAWKNAGVPVEMHVYAQGGHGFGMTSQNKPVDTWTARLAEWMGTLGLLR
ncbi:MAG: alpha/beta hydrolase [Bryobacter sp.]|nr:alpha/beta hydrolase [Bryobacter sp.]